MNRPRAYALAATLAGLACVGVTSAQPITLLSTGMARGFGRPHGDATRIFVRLDIERQWYPRGDWAVTLHPELSAAWWRTDAGDPEDRALEDYGLEVFARWSRAAPYGSLWPYAEIGWGGHLLTDTQFRGQTLSTAFQFGSALGFGIQWGKGARIETGVRLQHLSNADIKVPNDGMDFLWIYGALRI